jgi:hypothetical protein
MVWENIESKGIELLPKKGRKARAFTSSYLFAHYPFQPSLLLSFHCLNVSQKGGTLFQSRYTCNNKLIPVAFLNKI